MQCTLVAVYFVLSFLSYRYISFFLFFLTGICRSFFFFLTGIFRSFFSFLPVYFVLSFLTGIILSFLSFLPVYFCLSCPSYRYISVFLVFLTGIFLSFLSFLPVYFFLSSFLTRRRKCPTFTMPSLRPFARPKTRLKRIS
jgi:hypothetical protein